MRLVFLVVALLIAALQKAKMSHHGLKFIPNR